MYEESFQTAKYYIYFRLAMLLDYRHTYGDAEVPGFFAFQTGSLWATDATYFDWDPYFTNIFWERGKDDFDHAHLNLWYATEASRKNHATDEGWGFKLSGSKQIQRWVGFASYAYNTALGGGFGFTNSRQAIDVGIAYLNPLNITGETAAAFSWGEPLDEPDPIRGVESDRNQWGVEPYWRILLTPDLWLTPGVQLIWDPTFNPQEDFIAIYQIKGRLFF